MLRKHTITLYLPSKTPKGKNDALKAKAPQLAKRLSKIKKIHQDIYAKTYNDRRSKPQQKHRLGTVSKSFTWGFKSILRGHNPHPFFCRGKHKTFVQSAWKGSNSTVQHLREHKIKRIQRWNNDEDSTAKNNWNAEAKENQKLDFGGPDQSQSVKHQSTFWKVFHTYFLTIVRNENAISKYRLLNGNTIECSEHTHIYMYVHAHARMHTYRGMKITSAYTWHFWQLLWLHLSFSAN